MTESIEYAMNRASAAQISDHLLRCDAYFLPPLSRRVALRDYAQKLALNATRFEAWSSDTLVGIVAVYCNDHETKAAFITNVSVLHEWTGKGIATQLTDQCIAYVAAAGMDVISLEVASENGPAIKLYEKCGFVLDRTGAPFVTMKLCLKRGE